MMPGIFEKVKKWDWVAFKAECRWFLKYAVQYKGTVFVHVFLIVLSILFALASSVASRYLIDAVVGIDASLMVFAASLMVGMRVASLILKSVSARVGAKLDIRVHNEIQLGIYQSMLKTDWLSMQSYRSGDLMDRMGKDASVISSAITSFIPSLFASSVQFVGAFVLIASTDLMMAVLALIGVPLSVLASGLFAGRMRQYSQQMKQMSSDVVSFQQDSFQNMTVIQSFAAEPVFSNRLQQLQQKYRKKFLEFNGISIHASFLTGLLSLCVSMACFLWAVYCLWQGRVTFGQMTMVLQLASMLAGSLSSLMGLFPTLISIRTSTSRLKEVLDLKQEHAEAFDQNEVVSGFDVIFDQVSFGYDNTQVFKSCSLQIQENELVLIHGDSGCGKTTLFRLMLGLIQPISGSAYLQTHKGKKIVCSSSTRKLFGYVPQGNPIFLGTIEENLRMGNEACTTEEIWEALKVACADEFVAQFQDGLMHQIGGRDKLLSEGQIQRLSVARALLRKAPVLLLDEATSALDEKTEMQMLKNIKACHFVKTCVIVTHRMHIQDVCTRVLCLKDGVCIHE